MQKWLAGFTVIALCSMLTACATNKNVVSQYSSSLKVQASSVETSGISEASDATTDVFSASSQKVSSPTGNTTSKSSSKSSSSANTNTNTNTSTKSSSAVSSKSSQTPAKQYINVLIPEGYTLSQIGSKLETNEICTKTNFLATANSYKFSYYSLVSNIPSDANRCYTLEGYLFPNTYQFYKNMKPEDAIGVMLRGAESNIGTKYSYPGMTTAQVITLASIIQKEAANFSDMQNISSVFHNRLKANMKLQADSTIYYIERYVKPNLTGDINRYNSFYNTNKCPALPVGPICSPGTLALKAAVAPSNTNYLYFVADSSGKYYFAKTYEEQLQNCILAGVSPDSAETSQINS